MKRFKFDLGNGSLRINRWKGYVLARPDDLWSPLLPAEETFAVVSHRSTTGLTAEGRGLRLGAQEAAHWAVASDEGFIFFGEAHGAGGGVAYRLPSLAWIVRDKAIKGFLDRETADIPSLGDAADWARDQFGTFPDAVNWPAVGRFVKNVVKAEIEDRLRKGEVLDLSNRAQRALVERLDTKAGYGSFAAADAGAFVAYLAADGAFGFENGRGVFVADADLGDREAWKGLDGARRLYEAAVAYGEENAE